MAVPVGTNVVTSISRRYILPDIADNYYGSNPLFFRLNKMGKKIVQGGYQIELPLMYQGFAAGGWYSGMDALNVAPSDTVKNAAYDWKQAYVPVTVDGRTLVTTDSAEAICSFLALYFEQAQMQLADTIGAGMWSESVVSNQVDSLPAAIDNGTVAATFGGLTRSSNTFWNAQIDAATTTLSFAALQAIFGAATFGGRHPTAMFTDQHVYDEFVALFTATTYFQRGPGAIDEILAQAGWTNALFNGIPLIVDSHVPLNGSAHQIFGVNEAFGRLIIPKDVDFRLEDFITPVNQDAMTAKIYWMGDLCWNNLQTSFAMTNLT